MNIYDDGDFFAAYSSMARSQGGVFLFNIEHPAFTAGVRQEWVYNEVGEALYWPIDDYFIAGERETAFLGKSVKKQHHSPNGG
ncbi:MAG: hypothetical protein IJ234_00315, partial [Clostridia bacterium]|nr:hypothetical protein [Clostridia bacterium]